MNAKDTYFARDAKVDSAAVAPLPASRKIYVEGSRPDLRVPMREIAQSDTPTSLSDNENSEKNPPIVVYDTSGPYTDPAAAIDIRAGLPALRARWIAERNDTIELDGPTSAYGRARLADPELSRPALQPAAQAAAREGGRQPQRQRLADALRPARHGHAGDGVHRDPREPEARGDAAHAAAARDAPACRAELRRGDTGVRHTRIRS